MTDSPQYRSLKDVSDLELIEAARSGNLASLNELFSRHHAKVYALCVRMTRGDVAEDLTQEVFLRVVKFSKGFKGGALFTTWLFRIARNVCLDHLAHAKREDELRERWHLEVDDMTETPDSVPTEQLILLEAALQKLDVEKREVLVLSRFHGLSYAEVGEVCKCSVGAVKVRVHRALKELRQLVHKMQTEQT